MDGSNCVKGASYSIWPISNSGFDSAAFVPLITKGVLFVPVEMCEVEEALVDYGLLLKLNEIVAFELIWFKSS